MRTRTANIQVGLMLPSGWHQPVTEIIDWLRANGFESADPGGDDWLEKARDLAAAGIEVGAISGSIVRESMLSPDAGQRSAAIGGAAAAIRAAAPLGPMCHFVVMLPADSARPRAENFGYMIDSYSQLCPVLEECNARVVIEGWPGRGALCCNPDDLRALFRELGDSMAIGINFDPSHLVRMGIDHVRFAHEFADRIYHMHGKDCEILADRLYAIGHEQAATFSRKVPFSGSVWRYCIPGQGEVRWSQILRILGDAGFDGSIGIEMEDANYHGSVETQQQGAIEAARYLHTC